MSKTFKCFIYNQEKNNTNRQLFVGPEIWAAVQMQQDKVNRIITCNEPLDLFAKEGGYQEICYENYVSVRRILETQQEVFQIKQYNMLFINY